MKNPNRQLGELAIFNEFTEMRQSLLFTLGNELDHIEHGFNNGTFEVITTLITENPREEP